MTDGSDGQWLEIRTDVGYNDGGGGLSPTSQFCPASPISVRPFTPTESWSFPKPPTSRGEPITHSGEDKGFVNPDPFVDPVSQPSPAGFSQVETVTRTFEPEAEDQLVVEIGDEVSVLMVFDDGWGKVKVLRRNGSTKSVQGLEGLIPIDCLRPKGDENPLFVDVSAN
ncbi:hypothetical protein BDM02DRAFT_3099400 [Thelephora ganbajun]|uniref:Uncharacterized protein n=1 Tax=Thelephora ganbajun TaxID=370292 RepID=A0ACB6ZAM9_THEGA|nr:hypothetical protein BDM02DRAFT_3099400 [Thelephora ganbajun]